MWFSTIRAMNGALLIPQSHWALILCYGLMAANGKMSTNSCLSRCAQLLNSIVPVVDGNTLIGIFFHRFPGNSIGKFALHLNENLTATDFPLFSQRRHSTCPFSPHALSLPHVSPAARVCGKLWCLLGNSPTVSAVSTDSIPCSVSSHIMYHIWDSRTTLYHRTRMWPQK